MNPAFGVATAARVLRQVRHDPRTVILLLVVPSLLIGLMAWILDDQQAFDRIGPVLLGLFPFTVMFLITSITMLRERRSGTLERLMTTPIGRFDLIGGYALSLGAVAVVQSLVAVGYATWVCGLTVDGNAWLLMLVAVTNGLLGTTLGLFASAFAGTEFQVIQFMPAIVFPQILLGGVFVPRDSMPTVLRSISDWLPLTHAVEAFQDVATSTDTARTLGEVVVVIAWATGFVVLGSVTLRRRTG